MSQTQSPSADVEQDRAPADDEPQQDLTGDNNDMSHEDLLQDFDFEVKEQDRWLPIANVARIMKGALPENAKIAKEAKECMQECVSEFISFITSEASEKCQQEKRKTVNGEDILFAMTSLGFENYGEALKIYLARYRENLSVRSDQPQKPATATGTTAGSNSTTSPYNDTPSHGGLANPVDQPTDGATDFAYVVGGNNNADF
ncbi:uncharacterized protein K489DRAFT_172991 [Dissoconium aciculare CBS 342.82]|uniref:Transcription factor CBF/NF-Y/archaeal histone domain-containing protein n=1 Tax=Dissoconium aciculare CBS 342.82 TaxID=1314786 RepID=A0A6J3M8Z6_9PEZI|nr:uncharacterized protein K489DRAFT_172991 [Dissoconium aciculare CBS 342.82]KAF1824074.1 hypothetical protein K489DRAFT_172991 [Dissoconium aciculare CBS 342.82]